MASILDRYGIKEVADVTFYEIDKTTGDAGKPVLYLDTLKVSTIEQTAETTDARGGKGNPKLITWDYGKDITVTLEDALFSAKSLSIMFGDGTVDTTGTKVRRTVMVKVAGEEQEVDVGDGKKEKKMVAVDPTSFVADVYDSNKGGSVRKTVVLSGDVKDSEVSYANSGLKIEKVTTEEGKECGFTDINGETDASISLHADVEIGDRIFITYWASAKVKEVVISADSFPGTYYVTGDTYARSDVDGSDQFFQFIIPKAKVTSENTITLEAEGDPSVFNMNLSVLRPESGDMMKLVQYDLDGGAVTLD